MAEILGIRPWEHRLMSVGELDDAMAYTEATIKKIKEAQS